MGCWVHEVRLGFSLVSGVCRGGVCCVLGVLVGFLVGFLVEFFFYSILGVGWDCVVFVCGLWFWRFASGCVGVVKCSFLVLWAGYTCCRVGLGRGGIVGLVYVLDWGLGFTCSGICRMLSIQLVTFVFGMIVGLFGGCAGYIGGVVVAVWVGANIRVVLLAVRGVFVSHGGQRLFGGFVV